LADWGTFLPATFGPWAEVAMWQYSGSGACPGISGQVDLNRISRDIAGLKLLGKPAPKPTVTKVNVAKAALKPTPDHTSIAVGTVHKGDTLTFTSKVTPHWAEVHMTSGSCAGRIGWLLRADLITI